MCIEPCGPAVATSAGSKLLLIRQIDLICANVLGSQRIRRLAEVACEQRNLLEIGCLRVTRQISYLHILRHSLSKNGHGGGSFATWQRCNKQRLHDVAIGPLKNAVLWVGTNDCHAAATAKRFCPRYTR